MFLRIMVVFITRHEFKRKGFRHKADLTALNRAEQVIAEDHRP
jgi:hypothetical protein